MAAAGPEPGRQLATLLGLRQTVGHVAGGGDLRQNDFPPGRMAGAKVRKAPKVLSHASVWVPLFDYGRQGHS
jgi:hypothetical protein